MVGIKSRVSDVQVAPDDLIACVGFADVGPLVADQVVVIHIAMNAAVAIEINIIYVAANDVSVDLDDGMAAVDVNVGNANDRTAAGDPAAAAPAMIVNAMPMPVAVVIQPCPDGEWRTEKEDGGRVQAEIGGGAKINDIRVVGRDIDVLRLRGDDTDIVTIHVHLLPLIGD
jgi:hypothetical protein